MRRLLALLLILVPLVAVHAAERVFHLVELGPSVESLEITRRSTMPELAKLGFHEGKNLVFDQRAGTPASFPALAREIAAAKPDAILAVGGEAISAMREVTSTIPIVMFGADPVKAGYAASLARPGGNMTGVVILATELDGKRVDLLHEALPSIRRIAGLLIGSAPGRENSESQMRDAADRSRLEFTAVEVAGPQDYLNAFRAMQVAGVQGVAVMANAFFYRDRAQLAAAAAEAKLAMACEWAEMARAGCLIGYGPSRSELRRRMAHQVAQIFNGTAPADVPIEQPTRYEMVVNLKTAKALGLTVPQSLLARVDEVIE